MNEVRVVNPLYKKVRIMYISGQASQTVQAETMHKKYKSAAIRIANTIDVSKSEDSTTVILI
jgi:hypothetical protein